MTVFRWNEWNVEHIAKHGVLPEEAEYVVRWPWPAHPRKEGRNKYASRGQTESGRFLQVVYVYDPPGVAYVIHARPLDEAEKRRLRRRRR